MKLCICVVAAQMLSCLSFDVSDVAFLEFYPHVNNGKKRSLSPGPFSAFSMLHTEKCAILKSWELAFSMQHWKAENGRGDEWKACNIEKLGMGLGTRLKKIG